MPHLKGFQHAQQLVVGDGGEAMHFGSDMSTPILTNTELHPPLVSTRKHIHSTPSSSCIRAGLHLKGFQHAQQLVVGDGGKELRQGGQLLLVAVCLLVVICLLVGVC